jgi:glucose-1-phosphate thymidylyltransferase
MKAIVLAGGYAKRLWPLTKHTPKPLLNMNGKPILDLIVEKLDRIEDINKIYISTNKRFEKSFENWMKNHAYTKPIELIVENTNSEEEKLGTIAGLDFAIKSRKINEDCIIIAGDNLFDFKIEDFLEFYKKQKGPVVAIFDVGSLEEAKKFGVVTVDENLKIVEFVEKPEKPKASLIATCCYAFPRYVLDLISEYIKEGNKKDSPGYFLQWLHKKECVYAFVFNGHWFDIGDFACLEKARKFLKTCKG